MTRDKRHNPYKEANEAFLVEKSKEEGVVVLDSGVMYKVLQEEHGDKRPKTKRISLEQKGHLISSMHLAS